MGELKLTQIWIYPIKSLGGIQLAEAQVMGKGLKHDRRWMLVDNAGQFFTQRAHPIMALFNLSLDEGALTITYKGSSINVPLDLPPIHVPLEVQIWDDKVIAFEVSRDHSQWFSQKMGIPCKLVVFPEENPRQVEPDHVAAGENVSLADAYPFLIIGQASLEDLNGRLTTPVSIKRFRPNLVFTGGEPYVEDSWKDITIGDATFRGIKPSSRCVLITIDPETAIQGVEPLRTLNTYRRKNNKTYFGQNMISMKLGTIRRGDIIAVHNTVGPGNGQLAGSQTTGLSA